MKSRQVGQNNVGANTPETKTRFATLLAEPVPTTTQAFGALMTNERAKYQTLVKESGARVD